MLTAVSNEIPSNLLKQLKVGGKMILPLETPEGEYLFLLKKIGEGKVEEKKLIGVRFVPLL
jgi:protein-L-isoaspartate(D-aspartate) O-methyltransferase